MTMGDDKSTFPQGGGRMAEATRRFDWSQTPLGPISGWPLSLRTIVQTMLAQKHAICLFWGPELTMLYNDSYAPILGQKEAGALGAPFKTVWSDVWNDLSRHVETALSGEGTYDTNLRLVMTRNGYEEETFWNFSYSPLYDDGGRIVGIINVTVDVTPVVEKDRQDEAAKANEALLRRELIHRVKNVMAITRSVVVASARYAKSLEEVRDTVIARLDALNAAQDFLYGQSDHADVGNVIRSVLNGHIDNDNRIAMDGPQVDISPEQALGLSLAIYELGTNAVKYGALSNSSGTVAINWTLTDSDRFALSWVEAGGPEVSPPERTGFGSKLTNQIAAAYFDGSASTRYETDGLRYDLAGRTRHEVPRNE